MASSPVKTQIGGLPSLQHFLMTVEAIFERIPKTEKSSIEDNIVFSSQSSKNAYSRWGCKSLSSTSGGSLIEDLTVLASQIITSMEIVLTICYEDSECEENQEVEFDWRPSGAIGRLSPSKYGSIIRFLTIWMIQQKADGQKVLELKYGLETDPQLDADCLVADSKFMKVAFGVDFKILLFNPLVFSTKDLSRNLKLTVLEDLSRAGPTLSVTTTPPPPTPLITHLQQTPAPTPATVPSSSIQDLPNFGSLFGFDHRLKTLETNFSEFKKTNQFATAISSIPGIVDLYIANRMNDAVKTAVQLQSERLREEAQAKNPDFINKINDVSHPAVSRLRKPATVAHTLLSHSTETKRVRSWCVETQGAGPVARMPQVAARALPTLLLPDAGNKVDVILNLRSEKGAINIRSWPQIEKLVNDQIEAQALIRSSNESKTSHAVASNLFELELKKILIDKMESNKSIHISDEQKNLYKALVDAYESDKLILDTYGDTISFKRCRDDEDKDEEPSAGSNRGSKRRRDGKELESTSAPKEKTSKTTGKSTEGSKSHHKSAGESAQAKEPMHTAKDLEEPAHEEFKIGVTKDQPNEETSQLLDWFQKPAKPPTPNRDWNKTLPNAHGPIQPWLSSLA
ncbi:hypothetical protein Tco_0412233 [Tanacetum coccineum]